MILKYVLKLKLKLNLILFMLGFILSSPLAFIYPEYYFSNLYGAMYNLLEQGYTDKVISKEKFDSFISKLDDIFNQW